MANGWPEALAHRLQNLEGGFEVQNVIDQIIIRLSYWKLLMGWLTIIPRGTYATASACNVKLGCCVHSQVQTW